jgi:hypothetical protein
LVAVPPADEGEADPILMRFVPPAVITTALAVLHKISIVDPTTGLVGNVILPAAVNE